MSLSISSDFFSQYSFREGSDIESALVGLQGEQPEFKPTERYQTINVREAMTLLTEVCDSLALAYAASKGAALNQDVLELMLNFQPVLKGSEGTSNTFVNAALSALKSHALALKIAEKKEFQASIKLVGKVAKHAEELAQKSRELAKQIRGLYKQSKKILSKAKNEEKEGDNRQDRKKHDTARLVQDAMQTDLDMSDLEGQIESAKIKEQHAQMVIENAALDTRTPSIVVSLVGRLGGAFSHFVGRSTTDEHNQELFEKMEAAVKEESDAAKAREKMEAKLRKRKAELQGAIRHLASEQEEDKNLGKAVAALEITTYSLKAIHLIFKNMGGFWKNIQKGYQQFETEEAANDLERAQPEEVIGLIRNSALNWLTLGKMTYDGNCAIEGVDSRFDGIMQNLPTSEEAAEVIADMSQKVLSITVEPLDDEDSKDDAQPVTTPLIAGEMSTDLALMDHGASEDIREQRLSVQDRVEQGGRDVQFQHAVQLAFSNGEARQYLEKSAEQGHLIAQQVLKVVQQCDDDHK